MGQAKSRGSPETRIESAVKSKDPRLEKLRADLGLPARVQFGDYLVKVDDKDEFLGEISNGFGLFRETRYAFAGIRSDKIGL